MSNTIICEQCKKELSKEDYMNHRKNYYTLGDTRILCITCLKKIFVEGLKGKSSE